MPTPQDDACELCPRSIVEAILFVGHPKNEPMTAEQIAAPDARRARTRDRRAGQRAQSGLSRHTAMPITSRPWTPGTAWNCARSSGRCAMCSTGGCGKHGCPRPPSMCWPSSPTSKDSRDPRSMTRRGRPCGALLTQLVRRRLLRIDRPPKKPRTARYYTTDRFLELFGLSGLHELPQSQDMD